MKRFEFRLDNILNYRSQVEKQRQILLSDVREQVAGQESSVAAADAAIMQAREELRRDAGVGEIDVARARQHRVHIAALRNRAAELTERLRMLEAEMARAREEAVRAQRQRKVLEMLRVRRHAKYLRKAERSEQNDLDDVAAKHVTIRRTAS